MDMWQIVSATAAAVVLFLYFKRRSSRLSREE
jgi:hypothetical protein